MITPFPDTNYSQQDAERLAPHMSGTNKLAEMLVLDVFSVEDLKKMIMIEVNRDNRKMILRKLIGRLHTKERNRIMACAQEHKNARKRG